MYLERARRRRAHSSSACLEVDAHHDPAEGRPTDLGEAGGGEDAAAADMELSPGDLLAWLRAHRVALEGTGAALSREVDGGVRELAADAAAPEARARDEAGHGPDAVVGLVLRLARPGDAGLEQQAQRMHFMASSYEVRSSALWIRSFMFESETEMGAVFTG